MKGLVLKDLLFIKSNLKALLVFIFCIVMSMFNSDGAITGILFFLPFFFTMLCISTFSYDEYNKWNAYAITFPGGRKVIVRSKYIMTLIMIALGFVATCAILFIMNYINSNINIDDLFLSLMGSMAGMTIVISIMYPLIYKFGIEKGRIILFATIVLISILSGILLNSIDLTSIVPFLDKFGIYLIPLICILFTYISYRISLAIYNKKEF